MLRCPKCNSVNIIPDRFSESGESCLMCGTQKGFIKEILESTALPVAGGGIPGSKENNVSRKKDKQPCARPGCEKGGFFHGFCTADFKVHFEISLKEYKANKTFKGEPPDVVAARIKGLGPAKFVPGKAVNDVPVRFGGEFLREFHPTLERVAPGLPMAVILPEDLRAKVSEIAEKEYRTVEQQALFIIDQALNQGQPKTTYLTMEIPAARIKAEIMRLIDTDPEMRASVASACKG